MDQIADLYVMLRANTKGFTSALAGASAEAEGFTGRIQHGMRGLATFGVLGTAALIGVGVAAVKMGSEFQANMVRVNSLAMGGKANLKQLENGVLSLAGQVGYSPNSLSQSLYHIASAFAGMHMSGRDALDALRIAAEGAQIGGSNLTETTIALNGAISAGVVKSSGWKTVMQGLFQTVGAGDMTMENLNQTIGTGILAIGPQFGATFADMGAAIATLGDAAIQGSKAGTELRMAIMDLAAQSKNGQKALAGIGIKAGELGADMRKGGLISAIGDLRRHLIAAKIPANEWGQIMTEAFTKRSAAPLAILLKQFDKLKGKLAIMNGQGQSFGQMWQARLGTVQQQVDDLKSKFEAWLTELGLKLMPIATKALQDINNGLGWLQQHQTVLKTLGVAAGTVLAVGLGMAAFAAAELAADFLAVALPIAAVAAGIYLLWTHCKLFRQIVRDVGSALKVALGASLNWLAHTALPDLKKAWNATLPVLKSAWNNTFHALMAAVNWFKNNPVKMVKQMLDQLKQWWRSHGAQVEQIAKAMWDDAKAYFKASVDVVIGLVKILWAGLKKAWGSIKTDAQDAWKLIRDMINGAFTGILDVAAIFVDIFTGKWSKLWSDVKKLVSDTWHNIWQVIGDELHLVESLMGTAWSFIKGAVGQAWNEVWSLIDKAWHRIVAAAKGQIHDLLAAVRAIPGEILSALGNLGNLLFSSGQKVIQGLINGVKSMTGKIGGGIGGVVSKLKGFLPFSPAKEGPLSGTGDPWYSGRSIANKLAQGLLDSRGVVAAAMTQLTTVDWATTRRRTSPAEAAKKRAEHQRKEERHQRAEAKKRAQEAIKRIHEYLQRLLNAVKAKEHGDITAREALSTFVTAHRGKNYSWDAVMAAKSKWRALDAQDARVLAQAIAVQTRVDHNRHATAGERHSAASKVAAARKQLQEMKTLLARIDAMHAESLRYHRAVTDHIKKVETRHTRRLGSRQAMEEDSMTYLGAAAAAGRLGAHTPVHPVRLLTRPPAGPDHRRSITPPILVHTHIELDGRRIAEVVQKHTLRHENRNSSNGMSRYTRR